MVHVTLAVLVSLLTAAQTPTSCEALAGRSLTVGEVASAELVPAGSWKTPDGKVLKALPASCRLVLRLAPSTGSSIVAEVWLPREGWNGRFLGTGNGSYGGALPYEWLAAFVPGGYAVAIDDMGTVPAKGVDGSALVGQPVKWLDFGSRTAHTTTVAAKEVVAAFYGRPAHHAYFDGCSAGGRQALIEVQRYPEDYDGVIAGCAARSQTRSVAQVVWMHRALRASPGALPSKEKILALKKAVLAACGPTDSGPDGNPWLVDPSRCTFDPAAVRCREADGPECLSEEQVAAVRQLYAGPSNPRTNAPLFPGLPRGAEAPGYWAWVAGQPQPPWDAIYRWVFGATWDAATLDFDRDQATVEAVLGPLLDADSLDLSRFEKRGGKLILWHGWSDPLLPAGSSIQYYRQLVEARRGDLAATRRFVRLFLVPGVAHCQGGPGADAFEAPFPGADADHDMLGALARWVEKGAAPDRIVASKLIDNEDPAKGIAFQRPLCPYPEIARYRGSGHRAKAESHACVAPEAGPAR